MLMKVYTGDAHITSAVNSVNSLPIVGSQNTDVKYCKKEDAYYMFNGVRWFQIELVTA